MPEVRFEAKAETVAVLDGYCSATGKCRLHLSINSSMTGQLQSCMKLKRFYALWLSKRVSLMTNYRPAYNRQKTAAKARGIQWCFTFESWLSFWMNSGFINLRGRGKGKYVMARLGDVGPYSESNVEIVLCEKNASDARANHPRTTYDLKSRQIGSGRGWTRVGCKFQVTVSKKYIGTYRTQQEAECAYQDAAVLMLSSCSNFVAGVNPTESEDHRK